VNEDPTAQQLADIAWMSVQEVQRFGLPPKVAFLSHSSYGSSKRASARKMREARDLFVAAHPEIECDGELHGDAALEPTSATLHGGFDAQRLGQSADLPEH
jgi:malate dehydrogenase (oxaloacetate-decarboxylating)(NADP+)